MWSFLGDNFWNLSARGLVPTHSVLSAGGLSTSEVGSSCQCAGTACGARKARTPLQSREATINRLYIAHILYLQYVNSLVLPIPIRFAQQRIKRSVLTVVGCALWKVQDSSERSTRFVRQSQTGTANNQMLATAVDPRYAVAPPHPAYLGASKLR